MVGCLCAFSLSSHKLSDELKTSVHSVLHTHFISIERLIKQERKKFKTITSSNNLFFNNKKKTGERKYDHNSARKEIWIT